MIIKTFFPLTIGAAIELTSFFQIVSPSFTLSEKILEPDEKIAWLSVITISDEIKKSVASAYNESAVFRDQRMTPDLVSILYISAEDVIAIKSSEKIAELT